MYTQCFNTDFILHPLTFCSDSPTRIWYLLSVKLQPSKSRTHCIKKGYFVYFRLLHTLETWWIKYKIPNVEFEGGRGICLLWLPKSLPKGEAYFPLWYYQFNFFTFSKNVHGTRSFDGPDTFFIKKMESLKCSLIFSVSFWVKILEMYIGWFISQILL